jgi:hypothetical protein
VRGQIPQLLTRSVVVGAVLPQFARGVQGREPRLHAQEVRPSTAANAGEPG